MSELHLHQIQLLQWIELEMEEEKRRYSFEGAERLKDLRTSGVVLHPISVSRKSFGFADYPEIEFRFPVACDLQLFKDNSSIECFIEGEESVKGILLGIDSKKGKVRLYSPDFPDWIEEKGVGIKLSPNHRTAEIMKKNIEDLKLTPKLFELFTRIHDKKPFDTNERRQEPLSFRSSTLNDSQKSAVEAVVGNEGLTIIHGPPGTGKTTTLIEAIAQLSEKGKTILATAPTNTAVDNLAKGLIAHGIRVLRVGTSSKIDESIYPYTLEGSLRDSKTSKEIKRLKIQAEEYRKMAFQYKRKFGKAEREQRNALYKEVKEIRKHIKKIKDHHNEILFKKANVILSTPIGLHNFLDHRNQFDVLIMDEAGQMLEPLAWGVFSFANKWVLAGDPFQLPPTVLSSKASIEGYNKSILERCFGNDSRNYFLDTQYRMRESIAEFSNKQFYQSKLKTPEFLKDQGCHIMFYDTAGAGFDEVSGDNGSSLMNEGELDAVLTIVEKNRIDLKSTIFISPYSGQITKAKEQFPSELQVSTIDSFQGQEKEVVILSLARSNPEGTIGFLQDYRRMNVAMTRAKETLIIIGDSATIGQDKFFADFLDFVDTVGGYKSIWELN